MSKVLVEIKYVINTTNPVSSQNIVYVDGKIAYTTSNVSYIEQMNLQKLFDLMVIENVEVRVKE